MTQGERRDRRPRAALALALVAVAAAVVGAVGPADGVATTYSWPPRALPDDSPRRTWYAPLLLVREQPRALEARIPCALPPALPDAARPVTVLATARDPVAKGGLAVLHDSGELVLRTGGSELARVGAAFTPPVDADCSYLVRFAENRWTLEGGREGTSLGGDVSAMPYVSGLFSGLDLRAGQPPSIELTTAEHSSRTTVLQNLAWTVAVLGALAALILVSV